VRELALRRRGLDLRAGPAPGGVLPGSPRVPQEGSRPRRAGPVEVDGGLDVARRPAERAAARSAGCAFLGHAPPTVPPDRGGIGRPWRGTGTFLPGPCRIWDFLPGFLLARTSGAMISLILGSSPTRARTQSPDSPAHGRPRFTYRRSASPGSAAG